MKNKNANYTRREFIRTTGLGAAGFVLSTNKSLATSSAAPATSRPNLLFVFADQLGYSRCGYAGDKKAQTPNIDKLAASAANFRNAVSNMPVCSAYRASLFTGKYTTSTGMVINELRIQTDHETFGKVLTRSGYQTAYIGKWHLYANQLGHHYETKNSFVPPGPNRLGFDGYWAAYNFHQSVEGIDLSHCAIGGGGAEPQAAFLQNTGACAAWEDGHEWRALRDKQYTYAVYRVDKSELLFDNKNDPYQMNNLARNPIYIETLERFCKMLAGKMESLNDTFEKCTWYRDNWTDGNRNIIRTARG
jgi:arylsulfatase A-like enzyme